MRGERGWWFASSVTRVSIAWCIRVCTCAAASLLLVACGAAGKSAPSSTGRAVLSVRQVKAAFGREGVVLRVAVDSRTLDQKRIAQLTRLRVGDVGVIRAASLALRSWLGQMRARAAAHPVVWLRSSAGLDAAGANTVDVMVWGRSSDAEAQMAKATGALRSNPAPGLAVVRNAFIGSDADADPATAARINAVVKALRNS
jgi:hypothetical protein